MPPESKASKKRYRGDRPFQNPEDSITQDVVLCPVCGQLTNNHRRNCKRRDTKLAEYVKQK